jgi:putative MFS transporter
VLARIERESLKGLARPENLVGLRGPMPPSPFGPGEHSIGIKGLIRSGAGGRALLLISVWFCQTLGFYGFNAWVPTLLAEQGFSIMRTLEQSSAISIGAVPGAWIASKIADRWERKYLIAIVAVLVGTSA